MPFFRAVGDIAVFQILFYQRSLNATASFVPMIQYVFTDTLAFGILGALLIMSVEDPPLKKGDKRHENAFHL